MGRVLASHARATIVTVGTAAAVLLAGCSGGAGAQPGPSSGGPPSRATTSTSTASASPTPTASPSVTASVAVPAAARAHTDEGAKAFARFFVDSLNTAQVTADPARLEAISDPGCEGCRAYIDLAHGLRAKHQHVTEPSLQVRSIGVRPDTTRTQAKLDLLIDESASKTVDANNQIVESFDAGRLTIRTTLRWTGSAWRVQQALLVTS